MQNQPRRCDLGGVQINVRGRFAFLGIEAGVRRLDPVRAGFQLG